QTVVTENTQIEMRSDSGSIHRVQTSANLADVVQALNALGATPQDLLSILQTLKSAGALRADLEIIWAVIMSFVRYIPRPVDSPRAAFDTQALARLQRDVARSGGTGDQQKEVARQFEALFLQQFIKQAREASSGVQGLFQSDQTRMAQSMYDEQIAMQLANPGMGLAQALLDQMQAGSDKDRTIHLTSGQPPELAQSRDPALKSRIGPDRPQHASSISALIEMLSETAVGRAAGAVVSAIRGAPQHVEQFVSRMTHAARQASAES